MKRPLTKIFKTIEILTTQQEVPLKQFFKTSFLLCLFLVSLGSTTYLAAQPNAPAGFVCNNNNSGPGAVFLAIGPNDTGDLCIEFRLFYAETATAPADPLTATEYVFGSTPGDGGGTNPFGFQLTGLMPGVDYTIYIFQYNSCTNEFSAPTSCMVTAGAAGPPATPVGFVCNPTGGDGQVFLAVGPNNVGMNDIVYRLFFAPTASAPADPLTATEHIFGSVPGDGGGTSAFGFTIMGLIPGTDYNFYLYQFNTVTMEFSDPPSVCMQTSSGTMPLPVTWLNPLTAKVMENNSISLNWSVADQVNNEKFVVEHSHNGIDFSSVGDLRGGGTTNLVQAYNFTHKNPVAGENYYRIQQVDFDGRDDRSNIATVWFNNDQQIIIYPNPATSTISVNSPKETLATIKNYLGKSLKTLILSEGENEILLDELSQGMYLLQFENGGVETFIKQ